MVGWCLMEVGPIASGLGFNGYDEQGKARHDRVRSCSIYKLETSHKVKDFLSNWNISAHNWLKYYVFLRQLENNTKASSFNFRATFITFLNSAIWHGFYPGYYIFFAGAGFMDYHSKLAETVLFPYFQWLPIFVIRALAYLWCYIGSAYFAIGFCLLSVEKFHKVYLSMYYYYHILLLGSLMLLILFTPKKIARV